MEERPTVAAVILGAGRGRRFGGPKAWAQLGGETLLGRVTSLARGAGLDPVIAVVPPVDRHPHPLPDDVMTIRNPDPERGLSSSLQIGLGAVPPGHAALVLLVDQPTLDPASVRAVLEARGGPPIVAARAGGRLGPPVLLEPDAFPIVATLSGDIGLREVLRRNHDLVRAVPVPAHAPDVDTPDDLARLEAG